MKLPQTVIITGANGPSAIHLARELLKQKCKLFLLIHDRSERVEALVNEYPGQVWLKSCDLSDYMQTQQAVLNCVEDSGLNPEALVHTAAIRSYDASPLTESDPAIWMRIINLNIKMAYNALRCVLPLLVKQKRGKVIIFGSNVTRTGLPYGSAYAAAKAALANLVRTLAWENATENIQINMISPGPINSKLEEDFEGKYLEFRKEYFSAYTKSHPAHKLVSHEDVTELILSLLNLEMNAVSGEEIFLTGGVL